jgi:outer membrane protein assembly factor BamB
MTMQSASRLVFGRVLGFIAATTVLIAADAACGENWPAWRGPTGQGVSSETNLPITWGPGEKVRWKVALPAAGNSTPIIWGDRVFITQANDVTQWPPKTPAYFAGGASKGGYAVAEKRSVMCFNRTDGSLLWQRDVVYKEPEMTHPTNPFCSASPVTDGERVIASHGPAGLVCYNFDGKELWRYDVGKIEHLWGTATSPILYGDLCIAWCGPGERQFFVALNKKTGEKVWETTEAGGDDGITSKTFLGSWGTPLIARVGNKDQLLFAVPFKLKGYDPLTGKELWSCAGPGTYCYTSPLFVDGVMVYGNNLVKLGGNGDISKDRPKHRVGAMKISTAVIVGDFLYVYSNAGVPECHRWKTGEEVWKGQIEKRPGGTAAWGSPVYADGRIYITDQEGTSTVFAAGPKYELLAINRLDEPCNASIAVSGGNLFIRTHKHLWCIGKGE